MAHLLTDTDIFASDSEIVTAGRRMDVGNAVAGAPGEGIAGITVDDFAAAICCLADGPTTVAVEPMLHCSSTSIGGVSTICGNAVFAAIAGPCAIPIDLCGGAVVAAVGVVAVTTLRCCIMRRPTSGCSTRR